MLVNKINQTKGLIDKCRNLENAKNKYEQYAEGLKHVKDLLAYYQKLQKFYSTLKRYKPEYFSEIDFTEIVGKLNNLLSDLKKGTPPKRFPIRNLIEQLEKHERKLRNEWSQYVSEISHGTIKTLNSIQVLYDDPEKIKRVVTKIEGFKESLPFNTEKITELENALGDAQKIVAQLDAEEEVQRFLELVTQGRATLSDVTPKIMAWVNKHNFSDKLKLSFSNAQRRM